MLLFIGALGFVSMTLLGFLHGGGGGRAGAHPLSGNSHALGGHSHGSLHAPVRAGGSGPQAVRGSHPSTARSGGGGGRSSLLLSLFVLSPLDVFSFAIGAGAVGVACKHLMAANLLAGAAIVGALAFNYGIVKPIMGNLLRFSSTPSEGLEGMVAQVGTAVTNFDKTGRGLVKLQLDGQITQLLATLEQSEIDQGIRVAKGDEVVVVEVNPVKNTCRVTRELSL